MHRYTLDVCPIALDIEPQSGSPTYQLFEIADLKVLLSAGDETPDSQIQFYLDAAVEWAEGAMHRSILPKTHRWLLRDFPRCYDPTITLPGGKTLSIQSVFYSLNGTQTELPVDEYQQDLLGNSGGRIAPARSRVWPTVATDDIAPVTITFTAGWEDALAVPADIKHAVAFAVSDALEIRGTADLESRGSNFETREQLVSAWRLPRFY